MTNNLAKRIGIETANAALALVSPPLGGVVYGARNAQKAQGSTSYGPFFGALIGTIVSVFTGLSIDKNSERLIYDSPRVAVMRESENTAQKLSSGIISPLLYLNNSFLVTSISSDDGKTANRAYGDKVITFNKETGRYELDFNEYNRFGRQSSRDLESLTYHMNAVGMQESKIEKLTASGDVVGAREAASELKNIQKEYEKVKAEYTTVRKVFEDAVTKMNSELDTLKPKQVIESQPVEKSK